MANSYTQLNVHAIFVVKHRECLITPNFQDKLYEYFGGILHEIKCYPLAIGGTADHVHLLYEMNKTHSLGDQMRIVKANSSKWINEKKLTLNRFEWQNGYAAFSVSKSDRDRVIKYITSQVEHHKNVKFKDEFYDLLKNYNVDYDERYLFDFF